MLAERAGVPLVFDQKADSERDQLFRVMEEATIFFESEFSKNPTAQEYVKGRGITDETRRSFRIGWAPDGWRNLHTYLRSKGWSDVVIEKAGLVKSKQSEVGSQKSGASSDEPSSARSADRQLPASGSSGFYDRFRGRVMFPMFDTSGRVVAFSGSASLSMTW